MEILQLEDLNVESKNPLLITTVIKRVFEYLPFQDIKDCRTVCKEWNATSQTFLREMGKVVISPSFGPLTFLEYCESHLPDLPFTHFRFIRTGFLLSELEEFFNVWGKNIHSLEFHDFDIMDRPHGLIDGLTLDPLIDLLPANGLQSLKIGKSGNTKINISLHKLANVKRLHLDEAEVILSPDSNGIKIAPLDITLKNIVTFLGHVILNDPCLNDLIDFSACENIWIENRSFDCDLSFDLSRNFSNARTIYFNLATLDNWDICYVKLDFLKLKDCSFTVATPIQVKHLTISHSKIDLSLLPKTVEHLTLGGGIKWLNRHNNDFPMNLPNLKYLSFNPDPLDTFFDICLFSNCCQLTDLELEATAVMGEHTWKKRRSIKLSLDWIPETVKRIKLVHGFSFDIHEKSIQVEVLELEGFYLSGIQNVIRLILPQILVLRFNDSISDKIEYIIETNLMIEKILLFVSNTVSEYRKSKDKNYFENSIFSKYVDKQSNYYEFTKQRGKTISEKEFLTFCFPSESMYRYS